jgi:DNA anti-recombination protein RmuC
MGLIKFIKSLFSKAEVETKAPEISEEVEKVVEAVETVKVKVKKTTKPKK